MSKQIGILANAHSSCKVLYGSYFFHRKYLQPRQVHILYGSFILQSFNLLFENATPNAMHAIECSLLPRFFIFESVKLHTAHRHYAHWSQRFSLPHLLLCRSFVVRRQQCCLRLIAGRRLRYLYHVSYSLRVGRYLTYAFLDRLCQHISFLIALSSTRLLL